MSDDSDESIAHMAEEDSWFAGLPVDVAKSAMEEAQALNSVESKIAPRIAEGMSIVAALSNDEVWADINGRVWRLDKMTTSHRANALRFIRKRANGLAQSAWWGYLGQMSRVDAMGHASPWEMGAHEDEQQMTLCETDPRAWLEQTPLVRRLAAMVEEDDRRSDRREARFVPRRNRSTWGQR